MFLFSFFQLQLSAVTALEGHLRVSFFLELESGGECDEDSGLDIKEVIYIKCSMPSQQLIKTQRIMTAETETSASLQHSLQSSSFQ